MTWLDEGRRRPKLWARGIGDDRQDCSAILAPRLSPEGLDLGTPWARTGEGCRGDWIARLQECPGTLGHTLPRAARNRSRRGCSAQEDEGEACADQQSQESARPRSPRTHERGRQAVPLGYPPQGEP